MSLWRYSVCPGVLEGRLPARTYGRCYKANHNALYDQRTTTINPPWEMVHGKWLNIQSSPPALNRGVTGYTQVLPSNARLSAGENESERYGVSDQESLNLGQNILKGELQRRRQPVLGCHSGPALNRGVAGKPQSSHWWFPIECWTVMTTGWGLILTTNYER
jgi:hypothetical protein